MFGRCNRAEEKVEVDSSRSSKDDSSSKGSNECRVAYGRSIDDVTI